MLNTDHDSILIAQYQLLISNSSHVDHVHTIQRWKIFGSYIEEEGRKWFLESRSEHSELGMGKERLFSELASANYGPLKYKYSWI
jgi:hypothetical protein